MDSLQLLSSIRNIPLVSSRLVEGFLSGNYRSVFRGPGIEFDEVREYSEDDDIRAIDWNVTARMASPYVKTFKEEREMCLILMIDVSHSLFTGSGAYSKADTAAIISALIANSAVCNNDKVGAVFFSEKIEKWVPPQKGHRHLMSLIKDIATIKATKKGSNLTAAIACVERSMKRRGICMIISDFRLSPSFKQISMLGKKHELIAIKITDPLEKDHPNTGLMEVQDPETGKTMPSLGFLSNYRKQHNEYWNTDLVYRQREFLRRGIPFLSISTEEDPALALLKFFKRRKKK